MQYLNKVKIVLLEPTHPGNIGATARSMKTMGLSQLVLVKPKKFPHVEASKRAAGAIDVLEQATVVDDLTAAVTDCSLILGTSVREREVNWPILDPRESAELVIEHMLDESDAGAGQGAAILFGRESSGLTNEEMDRCYSQIRIPANDEYSSLNLASAVQIISYELRIAALAKIGSGADLDQGHESDKPMSKAQARQQYASLAQREAYIEHLQQTLEQLDFVKSKPPTLLMRKLTRLYNKAQLSIEEIQILRGILTAIQTQISKAKP